MKNKTIFVLTALVFILISSFSGQETDQNWQAETLWESKEKIQRVIVADIDPKHEGDEIVSVAANGEVVYSYLSSGKWENDLLWTNPKSLTGAAAKEIFRDSDGLRGVAVADVRPDLPGNEVIIYGYSKMVTGIFYKK